MSDIEMRIFAMRRSGHHGVISWMRGLFDRPYLYNDVEIIGVHEPNGNAPDLGRSIPSNRYYDCFMMNFEDVDLDIYGDIDFAIWRDIQPKRELDVIVLRDPYNWFASVIRSPFRNMSYETLVARWKKQVRTCLDTDRFMDVNFNKWFLDVEYRRQLAERLGRPFNDRNLNKLGWMSSFDYEGFKDRAHEMDVLNRWKWVFHMEEYQKLVADTEVQDLASAYFGMEPPLSKLQAMQDNINDCE